MFRLQRHWSGLKARTHTGGRTAMFCGPLSTQQTSQGDRERFGTSIFGVATSLEAAALFERPFAHVTAVVLPLRRTHREVIQRKRWWLFARTSPDIRAALGDLDRFIAT